jgi:hypothetical protein
LLGGRGRGLDGRGESGGESERGGEGGGGLLADDSACHVDGDTARGGEKSRHDSW